MRDLSPEVGERLKKIRGNRSLTLEELAGLTGVSKPMLGQIERGQSSPTINTLWKIATGLKVPLSALINDQRTDYTIADIRQTEMITEDNGRMRAYPLFSYDPIRSMEIFQIEFDAQCSHSSEKHQEGVEEYIMVQQGRLVLEINGHNVELMEGQAIRFRADTQHAYRNPFNEGCSVYNMIFYPKR